MTSWKKKTVYKCLIAVVLFCGIVLISNFSKVSALMMDTNENVLIKHGSREKKLIAITFDDGPHPKETSQVLDVLKKYNVKATFFIAGKHAKWYKEPLVRASKEGHEIGNHTFNHPDISNLSSSQIEEEIVKCEDILKEVTGKKPTLFRPPFGSYREKELIEIAKKHDYKVVLWTGVDVKDWKNPGANSIADKIINKVQNGDIILLHDYATNDTVEALDMFIPKMIEKGFKFVTVSELIK
ncbi:polysaccharide deacetylase family protein [Clostridioides difficile]|nr:polysaccharide deacetylase family protein [Clostridioides difficile]MCA0683010.1 polysaccharide deacetylase family protein [Clostridioides difficile]MCR1429459.1 polysaccharide deacetylase family protein [Clostridioides difficile]MDB9658097.1 polysaccharide deacetylase family protein [Clostridioides difficile]MDC2871288.1 polysaccharide deacetylase family protein [Clostridioides difficile]